MKQSNVGRIAITLPRGLENSVINLDFILTIPKNVLEKKVGRLNPKQRSDMNRALKFSLGLGGLTGV